MHRRRLCIFTALISLILAQAAFARNVFVSHADSADSRLSTLSLEPFAFGRTITALPNFLTVLQGSNSQKFYLVSKSTNDTVVVLDGRFPNVSLATTRLSFSSTPLAARVSPDGRRVVVVGATGAGIVDTATDTIVLRMGDIDVGGSPTDVAISVDSRFAYVLSPSSSRITAIDLTTLRSAGSVNLDGGPTAMSLAPTGILYVTTNGGIYELTPSTLGTRAFLRTSTTPDAPVFTPDGSWAFARSSSATGARGIIAFNTTTRQLSETVATSSLNKLVPVTNRSIWAMTSGGTLLEISAGTDGTIIQRTPSFSSNINGALTDFISSGELPQPRYLVLSQAQQVFLLNLSTMDATPSAFIGYGSNLTLVAQSLNSSVFGSQAWNTRQIVPAGGTSLPLITGAYDQIGYPVVGAAVTYTTSTPGVSLSTGGSSTDIFGRTTSTATLPANLANGTIVTVNATIGNRTQSFNLTVGDPNLPGGGPGTGGGTGPVNITIITGQGRVLNEGITTAVDGGESLTVRVSDSTGRAIPNTSVRWTLTDNVPGGSLIPRGAQATEFTQGAFTLATNADGVSEADFATTPQPSVTPTRIFRIVAAIPSGPQVIFNITVVRQLRGIGGIAIVANPNNNSAIAAQSGQTLVGGISMTLRTSVEAAPAPGVGLRVRTDNTDPNLGPVASCAGGTVLSNEQGFVSCDLIITGRPGPATIFATIGGFYIYTYPLTVTVGTPSALRIISGNNQIGSPTNQTAPMVVQLLDSGGNPLAGQGIVWSYPNNVTVVNQQTITDASGRASATVTFPATPGPVFIRASSGALSANFQITTTAVVGGIVLVAGDNQTAFVNQPFGAPLQVRVNDSTGQPIANQNVTFSVSQGTATLSASSVLTNAQGLAQVNATAGSTAQAAVVNATISTGLSVRFNLTSRLAGPVFTSASFVNGASFQPGISPGSIAVITVAGIAPTLRGVVNGPNVVGPLPTTLNGVAITFNSIAAPIYYVSNVNNVETVAVQVPFEVLPGSATVTVSIPGGGSTTAQNVEILPVKPGVFTTVDPVTNQVIAVATRPDGSFVSSANPARRGEELRIFATGLGQTTPASGTNRTGAVGQSVAANLVVGVNNAGTRLISAELAVGLIGVYVVTIEVPADISGGPSAPIGLGVINAAGTAAEFSQATFLPIL